MAKKKKAAAKSGYGAGAIQIVEGVDHVRKRPGMYIGGLSKDGLHHLVWEILDNSVDEVINGHASQIKVTLDADRRGISIEDNGRGIPIDKHPQLKVPAVVAVFTKLGPAASSTDRATSTPEVFTAWGRRWPAAVATQGRRPRANVVCTLQHA